MLHPNNPAPFPVLFDEPTDAWAWPAPPFQWEHEPAPGHELEQPCRLDTQTGTDVDGFLLGLDIKAGSIRFRTTLTGPALALPFSRFQQLTLTSPMRTIEPLPGRPTDRLPLAAYERDITLVRADGSKTPPMRTVGLVKAEAGLFLFPPGDGDKSLLRAFVPRSAYQRFEAGVTALEAAAQHWVTTPAQLLSAIDRQRRMPVLSMGQSLQDLGQLTPEQIQRAAAQPGGVPLGERLVESGVMPQADLHTAIAHKMGYPLVDLARFPIDAQATAKLPLHTAVRYRSVPLMFHDQQIIVAMDRPARAVELQALYAVAPYQVVAVLAPKSQILAALIRLSRNGSWTDRLSLRTQFYSTTT